ncbi:hypothetical protein EIN_018820 [Entamoeba invadens IP1]|uniref:hypothetical protein n=1 Tax=Entamoeba invadens IP1 TaxID=370355 RepID=UPI0002C3D851|nr:hypothetical protein EIN_018820 [Entamoeba invadens IP1]ELP90523.1 hypothetical protein EIN_018820 [Entamoeba invadens IP1]|eukprot:XP_004257294.1 hypothetical protein EIN_018820 [Entamoeba invadens IP1]
MEGESKREYICTVGAFTKQGVKKSDEDDKELSSYSGRAVDIEAPLCDKCKKTMKTMLYLHCPTDVLQNRHVAVFYCPTHATYKAFSNPCKRFDSPQLDKQVEKIEKTKDEETSKVGFSFGLGDSSTQTTTGFGFEMCDLDDKALHTLVISQTKTPSKKSTQKKDKQEKERVCGKWIEWYDEYSTKSEFNENELEKLKTFKKEVDDLGGEDSFEEVEDKEWDVFTESMLNNPKQIIRYGGEPLIVNKCYKGLEISTTKCPHCGHLLNFEFQVLPSIISLMRDIPEFDSLFVFSCDHCERSSKSEVVVLSQSK